MPGQYDEETFKHIRQGGMKTAAAQTLAELAYDYENDLLGGGGEATYVEATGTLTKLHGPITQAAYDALGTPDPDTLYIIVG